MGGLVGPAFETLSVTGIQAAVRTAGFVSAVELPILLASDWQEHEIMKLANGEIVIKKGAANHLVPSEGVGGRLFLTDQRLHFSSHSFNVNVHEKSIELESIISIEAKHSDYISRRLSIYLNDGSVEHFIVYKRKEWVNDIEKAMRMIGRDIRDDTDIYRESHNQTSSSLRELFATSVIKAIIISIFVSVLIFILLLL